MMNKVFKTDSSTLDPRKIGIFVYCGTCGSIKQPIGRDASHNNGLCNRHECEGYEKEPFPGQLWSGESEQDFGYYVGTTGTTKEKEKR